MPDGRPTTWFRTPRRSLWGWGVATVIEVPAPWPDHLGVVAERLNGFATGPDVARTPGVGPVAFAAIPFARHEAARFVVPTGQGNRSVPVLSGGLVVIATTFGQIYAVVAP